MKPIRPLLCISGVIISFSAIVYNIAYSNIVRMRIHPSHFYYPILIKPYLTPIAPVNAITSVIRLDMGKDHIKEVRRRYLNKTESDDKHKIEQ